MTSSDRAEGTWAPPSASARRDASAETERETTTPSFEWPFDSWTEAAAWWYRPVVEHESWLALGYLFVGSILGPILSAAMIATLVITSSLVLAIIGVLLVIPAFAMVNALAGLERRRASWVDGEPIAPRELRPPQRGFWPRIGGRLSDPARWRQVAYLVVLAVAGPVLFAVGAAPWLVLVRVASGSAFGNFTFGGFLVAILLLGLAPRGTRFVANVATSFAAWFLGPDPNSALEERVVELSSQREQILDAVANERRRIERNLHDGVQQQMVALGIDIGRAEARIETDPDGAKQLLSDARDKVRGSIGELRQIGRGLHPAVLSDRGLDAALSAVVSNAPIPITVDVSTTRELPTDVAETAYYVVNEAVANVLKHAKARTASVKVDDDPGLLPAIRITVHDDGRGGADIRHASGTGLAGIAARVTGLDGVVDLDSPVGGPTVLTAVVPIRTTVAAGGARPADTEDHR